MKQLRFLNILSEMPLLLGVLYSQAITTNQDIFIWRAFAVSIEISIILVKIHYCLIKLLAKDHYCLIMLLGSLYRVFLDLTRQC